jgi:hydrogenase maturation protease
MNEWEWQLLEDKMAVDHLEIAGIEVRPGSRVRLRPRKGGDVMDIALAGQIATIECIEQDYEGKQHVCVILDDDPGRDMGLLRQPGHRFFFDAEEVEPLTPEEFPSVSTRKQTILVAGIGNIFLGDDGFGVEVVRRLANRDLPPDVRVSDFGIRGFDLAYALQDGYETTILVDACPHGDAPGTLYVIEPDLNLPDEAASSQPAIEAHAMNPVSVLRMARAMNIEVKNLLLVGCEPATLGGEEGRMGLSAPVEAALDEAVKLVESLILKVLEKNGPSATS